jgi:hypothetical protein
MVCPRVKPTMVLEEEENTDKDISEIHSSFFIT